MYRIGIDLGGTFVKAGLVNENGEIIRKSKIPTRIERPYAEIIKDMAEQAKTLCRDAGVPFEEIEKAGIGCPGTVDVTTGMIRYANNLDWYDVPMGETLSALLGKPVKISNDADAAALGEALYGAGKMYSDIIMLTIGTGLGSGVVLGKKLYGAEDGKDIELGHVVLQIGGEPCTCGRLGCAEAYCSATALIRDTKRAMLENKDSKMWEWAKGDLENVNGETAFACEKLGDEAAAAVIKKYVFYFAEAIMNYCNTLRPQAVVLGGGVCAQGENLIGRLRFLCEKGHFGYLGTPKVEIVIAELKNDAGILGAASL